jgi:hypothetical protein
MKNSTEPKKNRTRLVFEHEPDSDGSIMTVWALMLPLSAFALAAALALAYIFAHSEQALGVLLRVLANIIP